MKIGDPRGVLALAAGRRHNKRVRDWRIGHLIRCLQDKAEQAGIVTMLVDERGTSSTCPHCATRVPRPAGRAFRCPHCGFTGHRDLAGGASIAPRTPGGGPIRAGHPHPYPAQITHRRAGNHLPDVSTARRDPAAAPITATPEGPLAGRGPPHPDVGTSLANRPQRNARITQLHPASRANAE